MIFWVKIVVRLCGNILVGGKYIVPLGKEGKYHPATTPPLLLCHTRGTPPGKGREVLSCYYSSAAVSRSAYIEYIAYIARAIDDSM